ncbi:MAG TPA: TIM barrel protein [Armatimonadota bacterium]|nr:TIM barrel protein [Armatimonadota bacterium]
MTSSNTTTAFKFSVGVWNIHPGADPFGPPVRPDRTLAEKLKLFKSLGFDYVQFHDDDAVPADAPASELEHRANQLKKVLDGEGLRAEFVAPRIWEDPRTIDGAITANDPKARAYALERGKRAVDVAQFLETDRLVLWPAREGTYIRESKDPVRAADQMLEWINAITAYGPTIRILGEMKPNEPMDLMYWPTTGHFLAMCYRAADASRVGVLIESAHCILAGLDPSDEMAYALWHQKLWGVHLNDQDGLKFDEDKAFGSVNLRRAFNQVDTLIRNGYGEAGEVIGLDVKAMRTQNAEIAHEHLRTSRDVFLALEDLSRRIDRGVWRSLVEQRNYEALDRFILMSLLGRSTG